MKRTSRIIATVVVALSLGSVAASPANAEPTPSPTPPSSSLVQTTSIDPGHPAVKEGTFSLNKGQKEYVDLAVKAMSPTHTNSKGQIDWNWVEKVFKGHPVSKNGFGAGWWARKGNWSQFTHLSNNDKKGIIAWAKTHGGPNPKSTVDNALMQQRAPRPCKGETLAYVTDNDTIWDYLNSCDTDLLIAKAGVCSAAVAVLGTIAAVVTKGKTAPPTAIAAFACIGGLGWLTYAQKRSDLDAVIIRVDTKLQHHGSKWESPYWIYPQ